VTKTGRRWLHVVWHCWLVEPAILVVYLMLATVLITHLIANAAVQVADESLSVLVPIIIEDSECSGSCGGSFTIYCVTWQPGVSSRPIVVRASDFSAAYEGLGCQSRAE
jgi:hypothetical protein